jgi:hypothetical protein
MVYTLVHRGQDRNILLMRNISAYKNSIEFILPRRTCIFPIHIDKG